MMPEYSDDYPTCEETHATFRIYPGASHPDIVTARLGLRPTRIQTPDGPKPNPKRKNGWFLDSKEMVHSLDTRRHIDWLLDQIEPAAEELNRLMDEGANCDVNCFWVSRWGSGGPMLSPYQSRRLADLKLEVGWDCYFGGET